MESSILRTVSNAVVLLSMLALLQTIASAHDPGLSVAEVHILEGQYSAEVSFAVSDLERIKHLDLNNDGAISEQELTSATTELTAVADRLLAIQSDGQKIYLEDVKVEMRDGNSVHFILGFANKNAAEVRIGAPILKDLPRGHKQFLSVLDSNDKVLCERMLSAESQPFAIDLRASHGSVGFHESILRFVALGIEHILTGYDHLAFLLAVLLTGGSLRSNVKIISSFTVAHSITLALATFGLVRIPPSIVEPLIAVSIVVVGLENLIHRRVAARWVMTFGFGLIHGLGFASALQDLGIGSSGIGSAAIPLFSFNLGVELAQVTIAALVLPLIWKLQSRPKFAVKHVPALSALIVIAGLYWFLARTLM